MRGPVHALPSTAERLAGVPEGGCAGAGVCGAPGAADGAVEASRGRKPAPPNTCGTCPATWTGTSVCHCAAAGCHHTFASVTLFDAHRAQYGERGACRRPADLVMTSGPRVGEPVMFFREGMWRGPEMTEEQKLARFGRR